LKSSVEFDAGNRERISRASKEWRKRNSIWRSVSYLLSLDRKRIK
jgi:hypothetical protein